MRLLTLILILAAAAAPQAAWAQPAPTRPAVLDETAVPYLDATGRATYDRWLLTNLPRAVAIASNGKIGWASGLRTLEANREKAQSQCEEHGGADCRVYAENLDVVWPGRQTHTPAPPPPLVSTMNYDFVPDPRYFWHGPAAARGVVVWAHGSNGPDIDLRGLQPLPFVRAFNNAGYDVIRFQRAPLVDTVLRARGWLADELPALRRMGYRRVVVGGESRGGWTSLQMLDTAGLADAVLAVVPAAHGTGDSMNLTAQDDDLREIVADAPPSQTRVALVQFLNDPFTSNLEAHAQLMQRLRPKIGALLLIDRPPGFSGHFGANGAAFAQDFAACLLHFADDSAPPAACPVPKPGGPAVAQTAPSVPGATTGRVP